MTTNLKKKLKSQKFFIIISLLTTLMITPLNSKITCIMSSLPDHLYL